MIGFASMWKAFEKMPTISKRLLGRLVVPTYEEWKTADALQDCVFLADEEETDLAKSKIARIRRRS